MVELEIRARNEFDGGSTVASDEERDEGGARHGRKRHRSRKTRLHEMGNRDSDDSEDEGEADDEPPEGAGGDSSNEDGGEEGGEHSDLFNEFPAKKGKNKKPPARKKRADYRPGAAAAAAAFGGGGAGSVQGSTALSLVSDTDDSASIASSQVRAAQKRSFPVSGVTCVGCVLPLRVTPVDDFVCGSADKMTEMALYKMAALVYKTKVADPADREEVPVPEWHWKDIRSHYTLHRMDPRMQRFENMRLLAGMRKTLELQMLKTDEETGERQLDKTNAEMAMKMIKLQSDEMRLLTEGANANKAPGRSPRTGA